MLAGVHYNTPKVKNLTAELHLLLLYLLTYFAQRHTILHHLALANFRNEIFRSCTLQAQLTLGVLCEHLTNMIWKIVWNTIYRRGIY